METELDFTKKATILVVDDTPDNLALMSGLLKDDYKVKVANGGEKALKIAQSDTPPDLILLDIMMPEMDGYEVCKRLQMDVKTRDIPVIFLTAKSEEADETKGLELGAVDYITKPISPPILLARVKTHLVIKALRDFLWKRNEFIKKTFGRYISDEVVERLLESPDGLKLGGESLMVTIVMTDLRGFSAISEKLPPETVVEMLNNYLSSMIDIIFKYSGIINEIIGDAILILFGAPIMESDDADRAIACALDMQLAMKKVNQHNKKCGLPDLEMGIGINTGNVVVGNIGSSMRSKYAVIGNNVNLVARVESFTVGGQVLITESTFKAASLNLIVGGELSISFKGLEKPVNVYDITGVSGEYEISLPQSEMVFLPLAEEISMSFEVLDGKYCSGEKRQGRILKLAEKSAIFSSEAELTELTNLKVIFNDYGGCDVDCIIYAKVMKVSPDGFNCYEMRFTFVPWEIKRYFDEILKVD
jgi:class 3 adenylate cyclase/ActR/RegA family two-component response regulator